MSATPRGNRVAFDSASGSIPGDRPPRRFGVPYENSVRLILEQP